MRAGLRQLAVVKFPLLRATACHHAERSDTVMPDSLSQVPVISLAGCREALEAEKARGDAGAGLAELVDAVRVACEEAPDCARKGRVSCTRGPF